MLSFSGRISGIVLMHGILRIPLAMILDPLSLVSLGTRTCARHPYVLSEAESRGGERVSGCGGVWDKDACVREEKADWVYHWEESMKRKNWRGVKRQVILVNQKREMSNSARRFTPIVMSTSLLSCFKHVAERTWILRRNSYLVIYIVG